MQTVTAILVPLLVAAIAAWIQVGTWPARMRRTVRADLEIVNGMPDGAERDQLLLLVRYRTQEVLDRETRSILARYAVANFQLVLVVAGTGFSLLTAIGPTWEIARNHSLPCAYLGFNGDAHPSRQAAPREVSSRCAHRDGGGAAATSSFTATAPCRNASVPASAQPLVSGHGRRSAVGECRLVRSALR